MGSLPTVTPSLDLENIAHGTLSVLQKAISFDHASVVLFYRDTLRPIATIGAEVPETFSNVLSVCSWVFDQGEPALIDDVSQDMRYYMVDPDTRSELAVPLQTNGDTLGVLNLESKQLANFSQTDLETALSGAETLAWAVSAILIKQAEKAKLHGSQRLIQAEILSGIALQTGTNVKAEQVFTEVIEQLRLFFRVDVTAIWAVNPSTNSLELQSQAGEPDLAALSLRVVSIEDSGIVATVFRSHTVFASQNPDQLKQVPLASTLTQVPFNKVLAAPLSASQRVYGVLVAASTEEDPFTDHDINFIRTVGRQIGILIANAALYNQEQKRANLLRLINHISSEVSTLLDFDELAQRMVESIQETLSYETIQLMSRDQDRLVVKGSIGVNRETPQLGQSFPINQRIAGRAVRTARSYVVRNVLSDPDYEQSAALDSVNSQLVIPIKSKSTVLGVLVLYSAETAFFDDIDREAMESLASQAAIAIENARLYQESQKRLEEQSIVYQIGQDINSISDIRSLAETLVYQVANALNAGGCTVLLYALDGEALEQTAAYSFDPTPDAYNLLITYITDTQSASLYMRQPILFAQSTTDDDAPETSLLNALEESTLLIVPLSTGSANPIGYIVWLATEDSKFSAADVRLAETLAGQSALAIERARLQEETRRQLQRETILRRVAEAASSWADQHGMLTAVTEEIKRALRVNKCNVYLLEGNTLRLLHEQTATGPEESPTYEIIDLDETPAIRAALNVGSLITLHQEEQLSSAEKAHFALHAYGTIMMAPMISQNALIGTIEVLDERVSREFTSADKSLLEGIASEVSVALDNSRLYDNEQKRRTLLEKIQRSSQEIAGELQVDALLGVVVEQIVSVFNVDAADVIIQNRQTRIYTVQAAHNLSPAMVERQQLTSDALRSMLSNDAASIISTPADTQVAPKHLLETEGIQVIFSVPLLRGDILFGVLNLYSQEERIFSENEQDLAELLGRQIAISLDNASLFEMLEERARQLAEVNRLKNEFLANVSHELRTPMNSIIGFTDTILMGIYGPLNETQEDRLNKVKRNALNLLTLIDDLLDLSKIEAGQMTFQMEQANISVELHEVCSTFEPQITEKDLVLYKHFPDELPNVNVDRQRLRQVIINLVSNAVKFTNEGSITVEASRSEYEKKPVVHMRISDTGIGIDQEDIHVIFDEFRQVDGSSTRQYEGTGLGLAICRKLIDLMDGDIWVESELGVGSTFHVVLPVIEGT